ncbi:hypothetical protein [Blautia sp.]
MASNQKTIFVYDDFSAGSPILMGTHAIFRQTVSSRKNDLWFVCGCIS